MTSVVSGLIFFVVANPETFKLMRRMLGPRVATPTGCPSTAGLFLHAVVFFLIVWGMMNLKRERMEGEEMSEETSDESAPAPADPMPMGEEETAMPPQAATAPADPMPMGEDSGDEEMPQTSPTVVENPTMVERMIAETKMSNVLGMPEEGLDMKSLKSGNYKQCACSDGSKIVLMN